MGVSRLLSYIKKHSVIIEYVNLVEVAANSPHGGIKLIVDFYSWEHYIRDNFKTSLERLTDNPYLFLYGGEYKAIHDYIESFVNVLRSVNIELVFYMDGSKGSSHHATRQKWNTWVNRQAHDVTTASLILGFFNREKPFEMIDAHESTRPCLQEVQSIISLQKLGCEIHPCLAGEADTFIARHMRDDEKAFGVLTNDTDFCIFPGSVFMPDMYFDLKNNLKRGCPSMELTKPDKLICGIIESEKLYQFLGLPSVEHLCELAIMEGNDFTLPILRETSSWRNIVGDVPRNVQLIKKFGKAEQCPMFAALLAFNPALRAAVDHSRQFYSLNLTHKGDGDDCNDDPIFSAISKGVKSAQFPSSIFSMYQSFYWHRVLVEDLRQTHNTAERSMVHLRSHIYAMLLPPEVNHVNEYGRTFESSFEQMLAVKTTYTDLPNLSVVIKSSFQKRRIIFHTIMSHQEERIPPFHKHSYFKMYGTKLGFSCYLLRYFLLLNWQKNLSLSAGEFLTICAWILGKHDPKPYQHYRFIPSGRCITIENWLLCLYRSAYAYLGCLLNITNAFSLPSDLFSGAVWVSLYSASHLVTIYDNAQFEAHQEVPMIHEENVITTIKTVLTDKRHVIEKIVKGLFPV